MWRVEKGSSRTNSGCGCAARPGETGKSKRRAAPLTQCVDCLGSLIRNTNAKQSITSPHQPVPDPSARPCSKTTSTVFTSGAHPYHQTSQPPPASHGTTIPTSSRRAYPKTPDPRAYSPRSPATAHPSLAVEAARLSRARSAHPPTHFLSTAHQPFLASPTQEIPSSRVYKENNRDRYRERKHTRQIAYLQRSKRRDIWE